MLRLSPAIRYPSPVRLNLGSGSSKLHGFINVDLYDPTADVKADLLDTLPWPDESVDEIVLSHVIEHLPYSVTGQYKECTNSFLQECFRIMGPRAVMWIETPDIEYHAKKIAETGEIDYQGMVSLNGEYFRPWDKDRYADWDYVAGARHINSFTYKRLERICQEVGFDVVRQLRSGSFYPFEWNLSVKLTKITVSNLS